MYESSSKSYSSLADFCNNLLNFWGNLFMMFICIACIVIRENEVLSLYLFMVVIFIHQSGCVSVIG